MFPLELLTTVATHIGVFFLGIVFDRVFLSKIKPHGEANIIVKWSEIVRVLVLFAVFFTFLASIVSSQFFSGNEPSIWLSIGGVFSFGSLIGESDFFKKLLSGYVNGNKK